MKARFHGTCSVCGCPIRPGQEIVPGRPGYGLSRGNNGTRHAQCPHDVGRKEEYERLIEMTGQKREKS